MKLIELVAMIHFLWVTKSSVSKRGMLNSQFGTTSITTNALATASFKLAINCTRPGRDLCLKQGLVRLSLMSAIADDRDISSRLAAEAHIISYPMSYCSSFDSRNVVLGDIVLWTP